MSPGRGLCLLLLSFRFGNACLEIDLGIFMDNTRPTLLSLTSYKRFTSSRRVIRFCSLVCHTGRSSEDASQRAAPEAHPGYVPPRLSTWAHVSEEVLVLTATAWDPDFRRLVAESGGVAVPPTAT